MLVPILMLVVVLIAALAVGLYTAKRRVIDRENPPDIRPDDPPPPDRAPAHRSANFRHS